jgi:NADH-quinone oxidoreductase subunit N
MIYGVTGSLYFPEVAAKISSVPLVILGFIFFFAGMGFKMSLVPFPLGQQTFTRVHRQRDIISFSCKQGAAAFIFIIILFRVFPLSR